MWSLLIRVAIGIIGTYVSIRLASPMGRARDMLTFLLAGLLWIFLFQRYIKDLFPSIKRAGEASALNKWQGRYYAYLGVQMRFFLVDDVVWLAAEDAMRIILPKVGERELFLLGDDYAVIPGHKIKGFSEAAVMRLMELRTQHRRADAGMIKFKSWLESSAYPNVKRLPSSAITR
ncbi:hypothetical protein [Undibacterium terreum]|uniref:Uncharacterized protein n=1 Tax=Undibacterium terreum TaxID=1224302 RepID=A0A916UKU9_9BURK|nr:hypothetical protein [Undibacterium terreum]GGC76875.1 hypothetical protein GCM10011396_25120 [Undibacterium terreum]